MDDGRIFSRFLVPLAGLIVRDPVTLAPLQPQGEWKPWIGAEGRLWRKRLRQGVVTVGEPPKSAPQRSKGKEE